MTKRTWPILVLLATAAAAAALAEACSETGPDAGPRTNGCIGEACFDATAGGEGGPGPGDGGPGQDGAFVFPNPLQGVTKTATLVKGGFQFTEGPVWIGGRLLFSDINSSPTTILELTPGNTTTTFRSPANGANGNAVDQMGRLVTCEGRSRLVTRSAAMTGAAKTTLASSFMGKPFNSPNDVIVRSDGNIYFTDPDYGADPDAAAPRQPKQGLFRIDLGGALTRVKEYDTEPNGVAFSPDSTKLYVADTEANVVNVWSVATDGVPTGETKFADVDGPDGIGVDDAGNIYVAGTAGIVVLDKKGAELGTITVGERPSNCTFGGDDRQTLYITAQTGLYKIKLNVPGLP